MVEKILLYERDAFFALNGSDSVFWDQFMWLYSGKVVWIPLILLILAVFFYKKQWREGLFLLLAIALVITLCDQFASHLCKPLFTRFRPTHHPDFMTEVDTVFGYRGGKYGFISSHAANAFGFATLLALLFKERLLTYTLFFWATLMAYSRVYLGVHFISDIVPGAISGICFGFLVYRLYMAIRSRWMPEQPRLDEVYSLKRIRLISYGIYITLLLLLVLGGPLVEIIRR